MTNKDENVYKSERFKSLLEIIYKQVGVTVFGKKTYALITGQSVSTIDKQISQCREIAPFKKLGNSINSKVIWNIVDVIEYLLKTTKVM